MRFVFLLLVAAALTPSALATSQTITGYIYCDNQFTFYFNGVLVRRHEESVGGFSLDTVNRMRGNVDINENKLGLSRSESE